MTNLLLLYIGILIGFIGGITLIALLNANNTAEVKRGKWEYYEHICSFDGGISAYACSECRGLVPEDIFERDDFNKNFCPNCGAKMERSGDNDNG